MWKDHGLQDTGIIMEKNTLLMKEYFQESCFGDALVFYFCGWQKCEPEHAFGPAVRTHFLFHFILSGKGSYERGGVRRELRAGQGFLILPGESTCYGADKEDPWEYCWIGFNGTEAENILTECGLGTDHLIYEDHSGGLLGQEMLRLVDSFNRAGANGYTLLGQLYLCFSHMVKKQPGNESVVQGYVRRALDFIHNNFSYEIGVWEIARAVGVDRTYLYRIFRKEVGKSPKEYLTAFRLKMAAGMLAGSSLPVTEIALSCGFKEASLFGKQFRAAYGCSASKYRKDKIKL